MSVFENIKQWSLSKSSNKTSQFQFDCNLFVDQIEKEGMVNVLIDKSPEMQKTALAIGDKAIAAVDKFVCGNWGGIDIESCGLLSACVENVGDSEVLGKMILGLELSLKGFEE